MICDPCKNTNHSGCPGGSWCDCQHRAPASQTIVVDTPIESAEGFGEM
jgi:hypothetical protein